MVQQLPAVLIGGPPHAGKSVLLYNLTYALYERGIQHHAIRACPDGEGNWFQEGKPDIVSLIRKKGTWSDEFRQRIRTDVEHRCLPFLVDMGGYPGESDIPLFRVCTHSILLLRADKSDSTILWQQMTTQLEPLAQLYSQQIGTSTLTSSSPVLEGTITGLERQAQTMRDNPVFETLVERVASLFKSSLEDVEQKALAEAPTQPVLNLPVALKNMFPTASIQWKPEMLVPFLHSLPTDKPLSVHGRGPNWLYASLAAHVAHKPFYQFDPKLAFGWIQPLRVSIGEQPSSPLHIEKHALPDVTILSITIPSGRLEYKGQPEYEGRLEYVQSGPLLFPALPTEKGLILDGPLPFWLLTALVRLYINAGIPWVGVHHAQQDSQKMAIVVYSRFAAHVPGDCVSLSV